MPVRLVAASIALLFVAALGQGHTSSDDWGFFAHKRINRMAVFTLPAELIGFYKPHIEYVTEHAVDPDMRRYATKFEGPRHYMDMDHFGTYPFPKVPRDWTGALMQYTTIRVAEAGGDTVRWTVDTLPDEEVRVRLGRHERTVADRDYRRFFRTHVEFNYYEDPWTFDCTVLDAFFGEDVDCAGIQIVDRLSPDGILPYHLQAMYRRLVKAFEAKDTEKIVRISAEFGHYIGDAHVPLHTTTNYNGQLTGQRGIHAFWESRVPELFADTEYDYFVGGAKEIGDPQAYFWNVVLESHLLVDSVLLIEKDLSRRIPEDRQYCYDERLGRTVRIQCREYAAAYQARLNGMIENRMRDAIRSVGSVWYSAWMAAGQPALDGMAVVSEDEAAQKTLRQQYQTGAIKGRDHR